MVILGDEGSRADSPCVMGGPGNAASLPSNFGKALPLYNAHGTCWPQTLGTEPPEKREPHLLRRCCTKFDLFSFWEKQVSLFQVLNFYFLLLK